MEDPPRKITYYTKEGMFVVYSDANLPWNDFHRIDGPAIMYSNNNGRGLKEEWHYEGKIHRDNGPAIIYENGLKIWCKDGNYHREDGPAFVSIDGGPSHWWLYNNVLDGVEEWMKENGINPMSMAPEDVVAFKLKFT